LAAVTIMTGFMLVFLLLPGPLARLLVEHDEALAVAVALIPIAGVFQIGDGLQVVAIGCLRGLGDVRSPVIATVIGFWLLGLPLGAYLAFGRNAGPAGLWWGLVTGLFLVAFALLVILRLRVGERRARLSVD
jgi:MATE family multidrug resistance protein